MGTLYAPNTKNVAVMRACRAPRCNRAEQQQESEPQNGAQVSACPYQSRNSALGLLVSSVHACPHWVQVHTIAVRDRWGDSDETVALQLSARLPHFRHFNGNWDGVMVMARLIEGAAASGSLCIETLGSGAQPCLRTHSESHGLTRSRESLAAR
jgi:hypothetical protein